jgi:hypothetical protein
MKIRLMGAELFQADRQTDMTKLIVPFRNFSKMPKSAKRDISDMPEGTEETQLQSLYPCRDSSYKPPPPE